MRNLLSTCDDFFTKVLVGLKGDLIAERGVFRESESDEGSEDSGPHDVFRSDGGVARGKEAAYRSFVGRRNFVFVFSHARKSRKYLECRSVPLRLVLRGRSVKPG